MNMGSAMMEIQDEYGQYYDGYSRRIWAVLWWIFKMNMDSAMMDIQDEHGQCCDGYSI